MTTGRINQVNWVGCWVVELLLLLPPQYIYNTSLSLSLSLCLGFTIRSLLLGFALLCFARLHLPRLASAWLLGLACPAAPSHERRHHFLLLLSFAHCRP